ncbi:MAG TPA: 30S ribosomal protein S6 [Firmicutes bacterium]|nr:30S ribosomal protein S6 [Bacillota bacterium]
MAVKGSYETVMVFSVKAGEEKAQELKEKFKTMIEEQAEEVSMDDWGKRKLAYPINYETEGYYVLFNYKSNTDFPAELDRVLNITEGVLRSLIVKK